VSLSWTLPRAGEPTPREDAVNHAEIAIIGGTGLGDALLAQAGGEPVPIDTPFGPPSAPPVVADWNGVPIAFLARHGIGHRFNPSNVPYRANIWALKQMGVKSILSSTAVGSLREDIEPGHLVVCDQVIDKTFRRASTFFDDGPVVHVEFAEPFCGELRAILSEAGKQISTPVHHAGTYVCMEGPQFSTRAESNLHRHWGADLIGMTCLPEAKLAREAEICYATIAMPTDYDCWRPADPNRRPDDLLREIGGNLKKATENALALIREALTLMPTKENKCGCREALRLAIWSDKTRIDDTVRRRLDPLIGRYMPQT